MGLELNQKQELFIAEYLVDRNATRAYKAAGYSENGASVGASKLLANAKVQARIAEIHDKRLKNLDITAERVLSELAKIGFANMLDYLRFGEGGNTTVDLAKLTYDQGAAIQEVTIEEFMERTGPGKEDVERVKRTKFKIGDKLRALEMLGRHLKLFTEKVEVTGKNGGPIEAQPAAVDLSKLADQELEDLHRLIETASV
jgi:phage terminase small subunit